MEFNCSTNRLQTGVDGRPLRVLLKDKEVEQKRTKTSITIKLSKKKYPQLERSEFSAAPQKLIAYIYLTYRCMSYKNLELWELVYDFIVLCDIVMGQI